MCFPRRNLICVAGGLRNFLNMSFTGTVEQGMVRLPPEMALPDGAKVRVESLSSPSVKLMPQHGYLVAVGSRRITWAETRPAMDEFP